MNISPFILGSGMASLAILQSLKIIESNHPEMTFLPVQKLKRSEALPDVRSLDLPVLLIATPHALHSKAILEADKSGFKLIVVEKPVAVSLDQVKSLRSVKTPVAVLHGYRQSWGIQTLKKMIDEGSLGDIISIEGKY